MSTIIFYQKKIYKFNIDMFQKSSITKLIKIDNNKKSYNLDVILSETQKNGKKKYDIKVNFETTLKKYVLMTIDPDAPSRKNPIHRFVLHYLVIDGKEIISLASPAPPLDSGEHRYYTVLYEYENKLKNKDIDKYKTCFDKNSRVCFNAIKFIKDNDLKYIGMVKVIAVG
jgi:phosphatidylethanolamine-binding protein (PEBP) family uncharacterized protein